MRSRSRTARPGSSTFRAAPCSRGSSTRIITPSYPRWSSNSGQCWIRGLQDRRGGVGCAEGLSGEDAAGPVDSGQLLRQPVAGRRPIDGGSRCGLDPASDFRHLCERPRGRGNELAFQLAKIPEDVGELPGGGHFGRGPDGKLNGLIYEPPALLRFMAVAASPHLAGTDVEVARVLCEAGGGRWQYDAARTGLDQARMGSDARQACPTR